MTQVIDPKSKEEGQRRHEMFVGLYGPDYAKRPDYLELHQKHFPESWSPKQVERWITGPRGDPFSALVKTRLPHSDPAGGQPLPRHPADPNYKSQWTPEQLEEQREFSRKQRELHAGFVKKYGENYHTNPDYKRDHPPIGLAASETGMHDEREPYVPTQEWLDNLKNHFGRTGSPGGKQLGGALLEQHLANPGGGTYETSPGYLAGHRIPGYDPDSIMTVGAAGSAAPWRASQQPPAPAGTARQRPITNYIDQIRSNVKQLGIGQSLGGYQ